MAKQEHSKVQLKDGRMVDRYYACSCGEGILVGEEIPNRFTTTLVVEERICDACGKKVILKSGLF